MSRFYGEDALPRLLKKRRIWIVVLICSLVAFAGVAILFFFLANRKNYLLIEILAIIISVLLLGFAFFIGTYILLSIRRRMNFLSLITNSEETICEGPFSLVEGMRYCEGIPFCRVEINPDGKLREFFIEEAFKNEAKDAKSVYLRNGFIVGVEEK